MPITITMTPKLQPEAFACKFDTGEFLLTLDREGMPDHMFEVRLRYVAQTTSQPTVAGFAVHIEHAQNLACIARQVVSRLSGLVPQMPAAEVLLQLEDVAMHWLMFNFRPALENTRIHRKISA